MRAILDPRTKPGDLRRAGHLFPLVAKEGGVLRRAGHTEAAVDLARLAGLIPAGVICEITDGIGMASREKLHEIAQEHGLPIVSIEALIKYRRLREKLVHRAAEADLPTRYGNGRIIGYRVEHEPGNEPVAFVMGDLQKAEAPLVRLHSSCFTGDLLDSLRCDCGDQLHMALAMIGEEQAGALIYLPQEGRGIGLIEKIRAYNLQDEGLDTVQANTALGFRADPRDYGIGLQILKDLGLSKVRLLTNNPKKTDAFVYYGYDLVVVDQVPIIAPPVPERQRYLDAKRDKLGHLLPARPCCEGAADDIDCEHPKDCSRAAGPSSDLSASVNGSSTGASARNTTPRSGLRPETIRGNQKRNSLPPPYRWILPGCCDVIAAQRAIQVADNDAMRIVRYFGHFEDSPGELVSIAIGLLGLPEFLQRHDAAWSAGPMRRGVAVATVAMGVWSSWAMGQRVSGH